MPGPQRIPRSTERFNPIDHVVLEPYTVPGALKPVKSRPNAPQPPRPQNAWILYRAWALNNLLENHPEFKGTPQSQLSKILGQKWASESPEVRKHFEHQANLNKERHAQEFPEYVFKPQKKEDKEREREERKKAKAKQRESEKVRKELEKALLSGSVPSSIMNLPKSTPDGKCETSALQNLALHVYSGGGPSPPISRCPSPEGIVVPGSEDSTNRKPKRLTWLVVSDLNTVTPEEPVTEVISSSTSGESTGTRTTVADQRRDEASSTVEHPSTQELAMSDYSQAPSSSSANSFDWSKIASSSKNGIDDFINRMFPPGVPGPSENRFEMPSGNIIISPGFIEGRTRNSNHYSSELLSNPAVSMSGILDDQHNCSLVNPHAEQSSSNGCNPGPSHVNEALFMQPFVQTGVSLDCLLPASKEVGDALLDEQEACANGERIMAAEHIQDGAPSSSMVKPAPISFLPSPPDSSSSATSPNATSGFEFGRATNLCATSSDHRTFGDLGFSDPVSSCDSALSSWNLSSFGTLDGFGCGTNNSASGFMPQLQTNVDDCGSSIRSALYTDVPPTPVSAGPWMGGQFDMGEMSMTDLSTSGFTNAYNDAQAQKEDSWFASCFAEPGAV